MARWLVLPCLLGIGVRTPLAAPPPFDERPARAGEWGRRPAADAVSLRNPPSFSWRPQKGASAYELQIARRPAFTAPAYEARVPYSVHCPSRALEGREGFWRVRAIRTGNAPSAWSSVRRFALPPVAEQVRLPVPDRATLLARIPDGHPRLFLRPEDLPRLRSEAEGARKEAWARVIAHCDRLLAKPPEPEEPPRYPEGMVRGSEAWRAMWWGNRKRTIRVLESAATLAFAWRMTANAAYGDLAERLLTAAATWDPRGATGYRTNDEAGMPYAYHLSRAYTLLQPRLPPRTRARCREVMRVRGREMYGHLRPRHLWRPYGSHANRAWHFLGEVGIAFLGEIPEAADWVDFAVQVGMNVYPVWSDDDGGWHEGVNYWSSYIRRFTWWAHVQRTALGLDAYRLPYFSKVGYYAMAMLPPGTVGGGFGDLNARVRSARLHGLMDLLARQAGNAHWRWYADAHGPPSPGTDWTSFVMSGGAAVEARPPTDLPSSRLFGGTGQATLNSNLLDGRRNVGVVFKSSPFGTQSHGYEAQNAFLLRAYGERLLIRSGYRDHYGSAHHRGWMWQTRSVNSISVDGKGQRPHSAAAVGRITGFGTSEDVDWVEGEAAEAYAPPLRRFRRRIVFVKPEWVVVFDRLAAREPATFTWHLHAPHPFELESESAALVRGEGAACRIRFLRPEGSLDLRVTDRFDPPPRPRVKLVEHHLDASTARPSTSATFVTVIRVGREVPPPIEVLLREVEAGFRLELPRAGRTPYVLRLGLTESS